MNDIIFSSTSQSLVNYFSDTMQSEFEMSMMGELSYFLRLQVKPLDKGLFISQSKYTEGLVHKFGLEKAKHARRPMSTIVKLAHDPEGINVD